MEKYTDGCAHSTVKDDWMVHPVVFFNWAAIKGRGQTIPGGSVDVTTSNVTGNNDGAGIGGGQKGSGTVGISCATAAIIPTP